MKLFTRRLYISGKPRLTILPNLCTFINAFLGLLAVIKAIEADFIIASYCIALAACMDVLDGALARFFDATSDFGMELDSLCDAISFCCVPAIVMYSWCLHDQGLLGFGVLACYLGAGLFRLARFNVTTVYAKDYFVGLPTTAAALCIASLVLCIPQGYLYTKKMVLYSMLVMSCLSVLMVSTIRFPSWKRLCRKKNRRLLGLLIVVSIIFYGLGLPVTCLLLTGYIVFSSIGALYSHIIRTSQYK